MGSQIYKIAPVANVNSSGDQNYVFSLTGGRKIQTQGSSWAFWERRFCLFVFGRSA